MRSGVLQTLEVVLLPHSGQYAILPDQLSFIMSKGMLSRQQSSSNVCEYLKGECLPRTSVVYSIINQASTFPGFI